MTHRETLDFYDKNVDFYMERTKKATGALIVNKFHSYVSSGHILDLGCGYGKLAQAFIGLGLQVTPVDGSISMVEKAKELYNLDVLHQTFDEVDFPANSFDGIWACATLLHHPREKMPEMLDKLHRMAKSNAYFYMCFKYGEGETQREGGPLFYNYREKEVEYLLSQVDGWKVVEMWSSDDPRPEFPSPAWMNVILKKIEK